MIVRAIGVRGVVHVQADARLAVQMAKELRGVGHLTTTMCAWLVMGFAVFAGWEPQMGKRAPQIQIAGALGVRGGAHVQGNVHL